MLLLLAGAAAVSMPHRAVRTLPLRAASPMMTTDEESSIQRTQQAGDAAEGKAASTRLVTSGVTVSYDAGGRLTTSRSPSQPVLAAVTRTKAATMSETEPMFSLPGSNGPSDADLRAIFYQADSDLSGQIDRAELAEQLV